MSDTTDIIQYFEMGMRINEGLTTFNILFNTPLDPNVFRSGESFEFVISDNTLDDEFILVTGAVGKVKRDKKRGNKIYSITGTDKGLSLVKQPFTLDSNMDNPTEYTVEELLTMILAGTGITIGRGQKSLSKVIKLTTNGEAPNRFCGEWSTKQAAINQLFAQYIRFSGANQFRWFIDYAGSFRWFEINTDRGAKTYIFEDDDRILEAPIEEDPTSILNDFTGFYGPETDKTSIHLTNPASIAQYGLCIAPVFKEPNMTAAEMNTHLQRELDQKSVPIYSGSITFSGFYVYEPGNQIMFPNDPYYSDITFTVVDWKVSGTPAQPRTTINITSDESVISVANEFEVIQAIAKKEVQDKMATTGIVVNTPTSGDRMDVWLRAAGGSGSGSVVNVRNVGGNWKLQSA